MEKAVNQREGQRRIRRRRNRAAKGTALLFVGICVVLVLGSLLQPNRSFSENENRVLAEKPAFSWQGVTSKEYMQSLETYVSDQFLGRDLWVGLYMRCNLLLGKKEFNGVYLGKDGQLIQELSTPNAEEVRRNLAAINQFVEEQELDTTALFVPNAAWILEEQLPGGAPVGQQAQDYETIQKGLSNTIAWVDVATTLTEHQDEGLYYKTDHHWTSLGAMYAFTESAKTLGIEEVPTYEVYTVSSDFSGTLASKSGYRKEKDTIQVYGVKDTEEEYIVTRSDTAEKSTSVYDQTKLEQKNQYEVFFGGNYGMVDIMTTVETEKRLLIFKDSYANCFVPFLLPYYNEIVMVDARYYYDNVQTLIRNKKITDVLFLYNIDTFMTDTSLADVLLAE